MIKFIFGSNGSGKTTEIIRMLRQDAENGTPSILIVPEQEAVISERLTLERLPASAQLTLEVLNFSRLYNRVCREYGGLCYSYVTKPIKHLLMWQALRQVAPLLTEYRKNAESDPAFVKTMLGAVAEFKRACVTPKELEDVAASCDGSLGDRLRDLALICGTYDVLVSERYSDSADDLSRLCETLDEHSFFKGKNVYIDSFMSFTAVEHRVIERIFAQADNTALTVPLRDKSYSDISTASVEQSLRILKKNANRWGGHKDVVLERHRMDAHPSIVYLSENLWSLGRSATDGERPSANGHIVMELCDTSYAETEATAAHILKLLSEGARCRDIVIIMRDAEKYRGIIEPALENAGIPFYFSQKTDICALPPIKFILSAIRIRQYNWRKNDVVSHIKTGLCNFPMRSSDLFEEYINTWNIQGSRFTGEDWTMNPDGFTERISDRAKVILATANDIKRKLCEPLEEFFIQLDSADSVPDMCRAVYAYLEKAELEKRLLALSERELTFGNKKGAAELASAYGIILSTLANIADALPSERISIDDFYTVLKTVFDQTDIGTIPTSVDEVTVGSASVLRSNNPRYVFVLGLCEGEFPASVDDTGVLSNRDRSKLDELGLVLDGDKDTRSSDELMFVKNAFAAPLERLYLLSSLYGANGENRTPSLPFRRASLLFNDLEVHRYRGADLSFLSGSPRSAAAQLRNIRDDTDRRAATKAIAEHLPLVDTLSNIPTSEEKCRIDPRIIRQMIGDRIYISPSSLEKYVKCPFSYYAGYMLSLRETKHGRFKLNDFGSFIHYVMEHIVRFAVPDKASDAIPTNEQISCEVEKIVGNYIQMISPDESLGTKRMEHLYTKLRRLSLLLIDSIIKELSDSDFRPAFFELHTNGKDGNPEPLTIPLDNGATVVLKGYIDRVDIWKNEGKVYIRIIDYKTGSKEFRLEDVEHGLNTQMLLYLFSVCRNPGTKLRERTELSEDEYPVPAGIVYLSSAFPKLELNDYKLNEEAILELTQAKLSRNGIILDEPSIINAISHSGSKEFLLGLVKKDGKFSGKALVSPENFAELYGKIERTLIEIGNNIYSGIADCDPIEYKDTDPCKYCNVKPLCRRDQTRRK